MKLIKTTAVAIAAAATASAALAGPVLDKINSQGFVQCGVSRFARFL